MGSVRSLSAGQLGKVPHDPRTQRERLMVKRPLLTSPVVVTGGGGSAAVAGAAAVDGAVASSAVGVWG